MGALTFTRIDRRSSIETEPRTLNTQQIQFAREAASYVVNTRTKEEAFQVFTEGLEPVVSSVRQGESAMAMTYYDSDEMLTITTNQLEQIRLDGLRDVLTAPF